MVTFLRNLKADVQTVIKARQQASAVFCHSC
jgi:hypothetical protein